MDTSYNERNREQTERLKALDRLSDEDLARPVGEDWTVGVTIAHIAYWDARVLGVLETSVRHDIPRAWWSAAESAGINDARLPVWLALPPREALRQAIQTAEALDRVVRDLPADIAEAITAERPGALDRSRHRAEHLDQVERALNA